MINLWGLYATKTDIKTEIPIELVKLEREYYSPFRKVVLMNFGKDWGYRFYYQSVRKQVPSLGRNTEDLPYEEYWDAPIFPTRLGALQWFKLNVYGWNTINWR